MPSQFWKPQVPGDPLLRILGLLAGTVGLPYFLLSSTSPLLQSWYSRANRGAMPYRFFALSNAGSILGLITYPVLVEPNLTNRHQAGLWSFSYIGFAAACAAVAFRSRRNDAAAPVISGREVAPSASQKLLWVTLAAAPSALMLAMTSHLTQNIAPVPFLWVPPLCLYLLSFIICFDNDRWYNRKLFAVLAFIALPALAYELVREDFPTLKLAAWFYCAVIFVLFMICHGELARRRPAPAHLTDFYLMASLGGAIGGLLIAVAAPYVFNALYDLPVMIALICGLFLYLLWPRPVSALHMTRFAVAASLTVAIVTYLANDLRNSNADSVVLARNFYGTLRVYDMATDHGQGPARILRHGTVDHGEQFLWPQNRRRPTTYFTGPSGIGRAIHRLQLEGPMHAGVIGLGAGTLAAYARLVDHYQFYDINPLVIGIASKQFNFLRDCMAPYEIVTDDARLALERERSQHFDLLVVDAFSGDAIPVHLLTHEAWALYWRHLNPDGVLAVHVSNRFLNLGPVVAMGAAANGKQARMVSYKGADMDEEADSDWVLVTSRRGFFDQDELKGVAKEIPPISGLRPWTDDYSNVWRILR